MYAILESAILDINLPPASKATEFDVEELALTVSYIIALLLLETLTRQPLVAIKSKILSPTSYQHIWSLSALQATTTVSRRFTDKASGAASDDGLSSEDVDSTQRKRSFLQRLHIGGSSRRSRSPLDPPRPPTAPAKVSGGAFKPTITIPPRVPASRSDAEIIEITQIMPESLTISTPPSSTASAKRQRSADGREAANRSGDQVNVDVPNQPVQLKDDIRIPTYLDKSSADRAAAFQDIEWKQRMRLLGAIQDHNSPYHVDKSDVVIARNRYAAVSPWARSRIKLNKPIGGSDYVNASPIKLRSRTTGRTSDDNAPTTEENYIATQGPKSGQYSHFWHMVHQETTGDVGVVIMLTQLVEGMKEKCAQYYPADLEHTTIELPSEEPEVTDGDEDGSDPFLDLIDTGTDNREVTAHTKQAEATGKDEVNAALDQPKKLSGTVTLLSKQFDSAVGCEVRKLQVVIDDQAKTIMHYLYTRWPDFGLPEAEDRRALIQLSRQTKVEAGPSPRVVHCSAGVGRTGTWIAMDFLLRELDEGRILDNQKLLTEADDDDANTNTATKAVDTWGKSGPPRIQTPTQEDTETKLSDDLIYETVNSLREQRMMMVYNEIQYGLLYEILKEAFFDKYAEKPEEIGIKTGSDLQQAGEPDRPRNKVPRISGTSEELEQQQGSDAETEIMDVDDSDDDDLYKKKTELI